MAFWWVVFHGYSITFLYRIVINSGENIILARIHIGIYIPMIGKISISLVWIISMLTIWISVSFCFLRSEIFTVWGEWFRSFFTSAGFCMKDVCEYYCVSYWNNWELFICFSGLYVSPPSQRNFPLDLPAQKPYLPTSPTRRQQAPTGWSPKKSGKRKISGLTSGRVLSR